MDYRTEEALSTPYKRASQVWDDRMGSARKQAYSWRLATFGSLTVALFSVLGLIYQSAKASVIPYVVEVDSAGKVRLVGTPVTQAWEPSDGVKRYFLEGWVRNVRGLSSDRDVVRQNWLTAYGAVTVKGKGQLDEYAREYKPFERVARDETKQVEITSVNRVSDDSWRVEWVEKVFIKGHYEGAESYVGIFQILRSVPTDLQELQTNPLGLYVEHLSWSLQAGLNTGESK